MSDFASEMQKVIALAVVEAQHQHSPMQRCLSHPMMWQIAARMGYQPAGEWLARMGLI